MAPLAAALRPASLRPAAMLALLLVLVSAAGALTEGVPGPVGHTEGLPGPVGHTEGAQGPTEEWAPRAEHGGVTEELWVTRRADPPLRGTTEAGVPPAEVLIDDVTTEGPGIDVVTTLGAPPGGVIVGEVTTDGTIVTSVAPPNGDDGTTEGATTVAPSTGGVIFDHVTTEGPTTEGITSAAPSAGGVTHDGVTTGGASTGGPTTEAGTTEGGTTDNASTPWNTEGVTAANTTDGEDLLATRYAETTAGTVGEESGVTGTLGAEVSTDGAPFDGFWGISEEPYRTILFWVLVSCSVLLLSTLLLLALSIIYAKIRGMRSSQATASNSSLPASKGSDQQADGKRAGSPV